MKEYGFNEKVRKVLRIWTFTVSLFTKGGKNIWSPFGVQILNPIWSPNRDLDFFFFPKKRL